MQLHRPDIQSQIAALDAQILVVSFAPLAELSDWVPFFRRHFVERYYKENHLNPPKTVFARTRFLADPKLEVYHAYGMGRHSPWTAYGPKIAWRYLRFIAQGKPLRLPKQDTLQKGGDFVVGRDSRLTLAHVGGDQSDRPSVEDILVALGGAGRR